MVDLVDFKSKDMKCLYCGHPFKGRSDKKFCSPNCKSEYHNQIKRGDLNMQKVLAGEGLVALMK